MHLKLWQTLKVCQRKKGFKSTHEYASQTLANLQGLPKEKGLPNEKKRLPFRAAFFFGIEIS